MTYFAWFYAWFGYLNYTTNNVSPKSDCYMNMSSYSTQLFFKWQTFLRMNDWASHTMRSSLCTSVSVWNTDCRRWAGYARL